MTKIQPEPWEQRVVVPHQFPDSSQFIGQEPLQWRGSWVLLRKDPSRLPKINTVIFFSKLSPKGLQPFTRGTALGKRKKSDLLGTIEYGLWTDTNSGRPKTSLWPASQTRGLWRSGDQWGFSWGPSHGGPSGSVNPSCSYFPSYGRHNWNRHPQQLSESPHWSRNLWSEGYYGGKGHVEAARTAST